MKRAISGIQLPGIEPTVVIAKLPKFVWLDPSTLLVDDSYQRNLSERSIKLIRKIASAWDWRRFKPPIVVLTDKGHEVIDGQHTAIAAASHPDVPKIPVMLVEAETTSERASAFLGHNRDRLAITATQMHHAAVAAKDEDAVTIEQVCRRVGIKILKLPPSQGIFKPRDTMAVAAIGALIREHGALRARQMLEVLSQAERAPIRADEIKAVGFLMSAPEYKSDFDPANLSITVRSMGEEAVREAKILTVSHKLPLWRALAVTWFKKVRKNARRVAA
ncbi:MAG: hypothetical protein P4M05_28120 [Bradyrhizobium sp.]|nr:hypothetical protein [Bradyrhizobium sp.]